MAYVLVKYLKLATKVTFIVALVVTIILSSFSVVANIILDPESPNIFRNGTVLVEPPDTEEYCVASATGALEPYASCSPDAGAICGQLYPATTKECSACSYFDQGTGYISDTMYGQDGEKLAVSITCEQNKNVFDVGTGWRQLPNIYEVGNINFTKETGFRCPSKDLLNHTYEVYKNNGQDLYGCANPEQIDLVDSCKVSAGNTVLNTQVTESFGCKTMEDGSVCPYEAVSVGDGNQVYQLETEKSCYGQDPYPSIDNNPDIGSLPTDNACTQIGNLYACPEDPQNVCSQTSSSVGGGTINQCQTGCGYVNNDFICYDTDTDSDGLPDYNDPDIDGDGIPNNDDLDSDGDGQDDPIHGGNNNGGGSTVNVDVDMSGVESRLDQIKNKLTFTSTLSKPNKEAFNKLYSQEEIEKLDAEILELQTQVKNEINTIRAEATSLMNISVSSAGYQQRNLVLKQGTFDVSLNRFNDFFVMLGAPIMFICSVFAAFILMGSRD